MSRRVAELAVVAVLALAGCSSAPPVGSPSAAPFETAGASQAASPSETASTAPAPTATPRPTATPAAVVPTCQPSQLAARITGWEGAAGQRVGHVEVTNAGAAPCRMKALDRPQLVDGHGSVLIDGAAPFASAYVTILAGGVLKTSVEASNYCGPDPLAPVSVAFVFPGGSARFVATALSPTDLSGVPPCFGAPGSAGSISMQAWVP